MREIGSFAKAIFPASAIILITNYYYSKISNFNFQEKLLYPWFWISKKNHFLKFFDHLFKNDPSLMLMLKFPSGTFGFKFPNKNWGERVQNLMK